MKDVVQLAATHLHKDLKLTRVTSAPHSAFSYRYTVKYDQTGIPSSSRVAAFNGTEVDKSNKLSSLVHIKSKEQVSVEAASAEGYWHIMWIWQR